MISILSGKVKDIQAQSIIIEVSGIGFQLGVPNEAAFLLGQDIELQVYFHWNQENGPQLFGFATNLEKAIFTKIIGCSGFGPKIGLAILSELNPDQFLQAIALSDVKLLSSISGIGPKKAEMLVTHLKDKVSKLAPSNNKSQEGATLIKIKDISEALASLKYSRIEVSTALDYLRKNCPMESSSFDDLLRKSLAYLAKRG